MDMPISNLHKKYTDEVKVIESNIKDIASGLAPQELYRYSQDKLDKLAERFQNNDQLGAARYKLYELQAILYYFQNKNDDALEFINQAIEVKGVSYTRAEQLIDQIESSKMFKHVRDDKQEKIEDKGSRHGVVFFHRQPLLVAALSFFTFNLYTLYWAYKHWRIIRLSKGERTYPILSSIFQIFTTYPLFKLIRNNSRKNGYKKFKRAGAAATLYIIILLLSNALWKASPKTTADFAVFIVLMVLMTASLSSIMALVQRAANHHNVSVLGKRHKFKDIYVGEVVFFIIGLAIGTLAIIGTYSSVGVVSINDLSSSAKDAYNRMELLRTEYNSCSNDLDIRRDSVDTSSDYEVNIYNSDLQNCEDTRLRLNNMVDEYNRLAGFE